MTFVAADLAARIRLEGKEAFDRALQSSGREFTNLERIAHATGRGIGTSLTVAGAALNIAIATTTALGVSVFKTGAAYNTLQQNSRAALTTLLGSTEAVNEQMAKLDAFARTSPFSKQVFITAQQQMLGFGYAAEDVIPTLDAVQNAVAGIGGNNQTLSELVFIMAQIKAAGKLTGQDLIQFGQRGINAAELIGQQFGKTGAQIRAEITAGTIGADEALSALAAGMAAKYGGTTAIIKEQMTGATDRVVAATRDIGAALARPFVDPNGGGQAVTWANELADLLRAVEAQTTPITNWAVGKLAPAFERLSTTLRNARDVVRTMDVSDLDQGLERIASYGPGIGVVTGALISMGTQIPILQRLGLTLNPVAGAFLGLVASSPELRRELGYLFRAFEPLTDLSAEFAKVLAQQLNVVVPVAASGIRLLADVATPLINLLGQIPAPVLAGAAAMFALHTAVGPLAASVLPRMMESLRGVGDQLRLHRHLAQMNGVEVGVFGAAASVARGRVVGLGTALKTAFLSNPIGLAITGISLAIGAWAAANADATAKTEEHKQSVADLQGTLDQATGAITQATRAALAKKVTDGEQAEELRVLGINTAAYVDALTGEQNALGLVRGELERQARANVEARVTNEAARAAIDRLNLSHFDLIEASQGSSAALARLREQAVASGGSFDDVTLALGSMGADTVGTGEAVTSLTGFLTEQQEALAEARQQAADYREAMRQASAAMSDAERSNSRLNEAIATARDASQDASTRLRALKQALDELRGGAQTAQEAEFELARQTLDLADALAQTGENGESLTQSLVNATGGIDRTSRQGIALFDTVNRINDSMLTAMQTTYDLAIANGETLTEAQRQATEAAGPFIEALRQTALDAGLTAEQAQGLIDKYLATPEVVGTLITDNGSIDDVQQRLLYLAGVISDTPDKTVVLDEPFSPEIEKRLEDLGFTITELPDGKIEVSAVGVDDAERELTNLVRDRVANVTVNVSGGGGGGRMQFQADGGMWNGPRRTFANGGSIGLTAAASGLLRREPMLVKGGANILWGEPETGWEAYISGKPGKEARNRTILAAAAARLGMQVVPVGAGRVTQAANGMGATMASSGGGDLVAAFVEAIKRAGLVGKIDVYGAPGQSEDEIAAAVAEQMWRPR